MNDQYLLFVLNKNKTTEKMSQWSTTQFSKKKNHQFPPNRNKNNRFVKISLCSYRIALNIII